MFYDDKELIADAKRGKRRATPFHLVHTHLVDRFKLGTGNSAAIWSSVGNTSGLSGIGNPRNGDFVWANANKISITVVEDNKKSHLYHPGSKKFRWDKCFGSK